MFSNTSGHLNERTPRARSYYEATDKGHDDLLRCHDCGRLVTYASLFSKGNTGFTRCCGIRKVKEVRALTFWEWLKVRLGLIDFDHRREFLAEFSHRRANGPQ